MENENIKIYVELCENLNECSKLLILSQLAIDEGELGESQKHFLNVKSILNTLINDTFKEVKELAQDEIYDSEDYDISSLNLAVLINDACKRASTLIGMENEDQSQSIKAVVLNKLISTINSIEELFATLFN